MLLADITSATSWNVGVPAQVVFKGEKCKKPQPCRKVWRRENAIPWGLVLIPDSVSQGVMLLFGLCAKILSAKSILQYRWVFIHHFLAQTASSRGFEMNLRLPRFMLAQIKSVFLSKLGKLLQYQPDLFYFRIFCCDNVTIFQLTEKPIFHIQDFKVWVSVLQQQQVLAWGIHRILRPTQCDIPGSCEIFTCTFIQLTYTRLEVVQWVFCMS